MELLEGQPLQSVLRERGQLSPSNVLGIARQVCRGLDYAHGQNVIHRDIKTANLFVTVDRVVKIMDFGLAKVLEEVRGATTLVGGTPYYMSPEQALDLVRQVGAVFAPEPHAQGAARALRVSLRRKSRVWPVESTAR